MIELVEELPNLYAMSFGLSQGRCVIGTGHIVASVDHLHRIVGQLHVRVFSEIAIHGDLSGGPYLPPVRCRNGIETDVRVHHCCASIFQSLSALPQLRVQRHR